MYIVIIKILYTEHQNICVLGIYIHIYRVIIYPYSINFSRMFRSFAFLRRKMVILNNVKKNSVIVTKCKGLILSLNLHSDTYIIIDWLSTWNLVFNR